MSSERFAPVDMLGRRSGCVVVVRRSANASGNAMWICRCDCGARVVFAGYRLRAYPPRWCAACSPRRSREPVRLPVGPHPSAFKSPRRGHR